MSTTTTKSFLRASSHVLTRHLLSKRMSISSSLAENNWKVLHNPDENEFLINLPPKLPDHQKSSVAVLQYDWLNRNTVDLVHTGVPEHYQRKGIAKVLAKRAFDYFLDENIQMKISCSYLVKFVKDTNYRSLAEIHQLP